jgi:hypothetical protein
MPPCLAEAMIGRMDDVDLEAAYTFESEDGVRVASVLDAACADDADLVLMASTLHAREMLTQDTDREIARNHALARALTYELVAHPDDPTRSAFHPLSKSESPWIAPLRSTSSEVLRLWESCLKAVTHPVLTAHFRDLLFSAGYYRGPDEARHVVHAYLQTGSDSLFWMQRLARALSISRSYGMQDAEQAIRGVLLRFAEEMQRDSGAIFLVVHALELLSRPPRARPEESREEERLRRLFACLWESIERNLFLTDALAAANRRFATTPKERREASEKHVWTYLRPNDPSPDIRRMWELTRAADLARSYELTDLHGQAVTALQAFAREPLRGHKISSSAAIPSWLMAVYLHPYRQAPHWRAGLDRWLQTQAPTGSWIDNQRHGRERTGLLSFVTNIKLGQHGMPEQTRSGPEAQSTVRIQRAEQQQAIFQGACLAEALALIAKKPGDLSEDALAAFLLAENLDKPLTIAYSHALMLFFEGRSSDAGQVALPIVEAAARGALLLLDEPLYRLEAGESSGRFPTLDFYIDALERRGLDEDWVRALRVILTRDGLNLRNTTAHGFKLNYSRVESALVLRLAGMLLYANGPSSTDESDAWSDRQTRFPEPRRRRGWRVMIIR